MKKIKIYYNSDLKTKLFDFCNQLKTNFFEIKNLYTAKFFKPGEEGGDGVDWSVEVIVYGDASVINSSNVDYTFIISNTDPNKPGCIFAGTDVDMYPVIIDNYLKPIIFIISPTNSGSSYLKAGLAQSSKIKTYKENELIHYNVDGMYVRDPQVRFTDNLQALQQQDFNNIAQSIKKYSKIDPYINEKIKVKEYNYYLDKVPKNIIVVDKLNELAISKKFIFLMRNPYAIAAGVKRHDIANYEENLISYDISWEAVGTHVLKMVEQQYNNINTFEGVYIKYETLTSDPTLVTQQLQEFLGLQDINLQSIKDPVKDRLYATELQDYNQTTINNIPEEGKVALKAVFSTRPDLFTYFGYSLDIS